MDNHWNCASATNVMIALLFVVSLQSCQCSDSRRNGGDTDTTVDAGTDAGADAGTDTDTGSEVIDTDFPSTAIPATCEEAIANPTSVGCDFFAVDLDLTIDEGDNPSIFAIVVSNPQLAEVVNIVLFDGTDGEIYSFDLDPGELRVINVACNSGCLVPPHEIAVQGISSGGGFRLTSDVPVLAYQWNPYGEAGTFTTDASLLLPTTSLQTLYIGAAWGFGPGIDYVENWTTYSQLTVVSTADETTVSFIPSVDVPEIGGIGPFAAGVASAPVTLNAFDVVSLSPAVRDADLTGTMVQADKPVAVFGGHTCGWVPNGNTSAGNHLEEQLLPLAAWGTNAVLARYAPRHHCWNEDLALWRIIAGADDMTVTFDPEAPEPAGAEHHFATRGEVLEFLAPGDYYAVGTQDAPTDPDHPEAPFQAYQLMTNAQYPLCSMSESGYGMWEGDPTMILVPPAGQYLDRYVFTTENAADFDYDHIVVVKPSGALVALDCLGLLPDELFTEVGSSDWGVARIFIDDPLDDTGCVDGAHLLTASEPIGLTVVGTAESDAYGYLGGIGLKLINPVIE